MKDNSNVFPNIDQYPVYGLMIDSNSSSQIKANRKKLLTRLNEEEEEEDNNDEYGFDLPLDYTLKCVK